MKNFITIFFLFFSSLAFAQFGTDTVQNTLIHNIAGFEQSVPLSATTITGKTYISWFDNSSGSYVLKMQLLDAAGNAMWGNGGMVVSAYPQGTALFRYDLAVDNDENAIVAFQDERSGTLKVVVYKVNLSGALVWGNAGVALSDSTADGLGPRIGITQSNNVIVAWNASAGSAKWISFQKISAGGNIMWSKRIKDSNKYSRAVMVPNGSDQIMMMYVREVGNFPGVTSTMFAQIFDANGIAVWPSPVQVSSKTIAYFFFPNIISDGNGGFYIAFNTSNPVSLSLNDVYAQHVYSNGTLWSASGTEVANSVTEHKSTGGFCYNSTTSSLYVALQVLDGSQGSSGVSIQQLDATGNVQFGPNALNIKPISATYFNPNAIVDAGNGLITIFTEGSAFGSQLIKAFKTDYSGNLIWAYEPTVCATASNKDDLSAGKFLNNQVVMVWADDRLGIGTDLGIYAQNLTGDGGFGITTGINENSFASAFSVFPNPGSHSSLRFISTVYTLAELQLTDVTGKLIFNQPVAVLSGENILTLPGDIQQGVYTITLREGSNVQHLRWIKQ